MRLTVGPLPPAVYWRRRSLVLGVALLVVFLIVQACMAATARSDKEDTATGPSPTAGETWAPLRRMDNRSRTPLTNRVSRRNRPRGRSAPTRKSS